MNMESERRRDELLEMLWRLDEFYTLDMSSLRVHDLDHKYEHYLAEFANNGMIRLHGDQIELTQQGRTKAEGLVRRHRLAERLLVDVLGKDPTATEKAACEFEHILATELVDAICTLLGHPSTCPHGIPIPPGPCCKEARGSVESAVIPLSHLGIGHKTSIAFVNTRDKNRLNKLMAMGLTPGVKVELLQNYPTLVVQIEQSQIAFEESVGNVIQVWRPLPENGLEL